jgi:hypothetical protein
MEFVCLFVVVASEVGGQCSLLRLNFLHSQTIQHSTLKIIQKRRWIIRIIKSRRMRWADHVARIGEEARV